MPGGYSKEASKLRAQEERYEMGQHLHAQTAKAQGDQAGMQRNFPLKLMKPDYNDDMMELKKDLVGGRATGATPLGVATLGQEEMRYLMDKQKRKQYVDEMRFFDMMFADANPAEAERLRRINPVLHNARLQDLEDRADLQKRLAKIRIEGSISDMDDFRLLYNIYVGRVDLPAGPLYAPKMGEHDNHRGFGIFNPHRLLKTNKKKAIQDFFDQHFPWFNAKDYANLPAFSPDVGTTSFIDDFISRNGAYGRDPAPPVPPNPNDG